MVTLGHDELTFVIDVNPRAYQSIELAYSLRIYNGDSTWIDNILVVVLVVVVANIIIAMSYDHYGHYHHSRHSSYTKFQ